MKLSWLSLLIVEYSDKEATKSYLFKLDFFSGAESPQAVRKLMALAEPGKARPRKLTSSVSSKSSLQSNTSPVTSPAMNTRRRAAVVAAAAAAVQQQHSGSGKNGYF